MGEVLFACWGARRYKLKEKAACLEWYTGELEGEEEMKSVQAGIWVTWSDEIQVAHELFRRELHCGGFLGSLWNFQQE